MRYWRLILFPFAWLYGLIIYIRHILFHIGILKQHKFDLPIIGVGNIAMGGTGKTPMIEYLIRLLSTKYKIAVLSRGYGRKTKGFIIANQYSSAFDIGDEPAQFYRKFGKKITVAVDEKRVRGIKNLLQNDIDLEVILLDDSFQHRYVNPGLNILLTDIRHLYVKDYLFPVGHLRDLKISASRADIIVVTKTDIVLSPIVRRNVTNLLNPTPFQKLYFSFYKYDDFVPVPNLEITPMQKKRPSVIVLFTGIANPWTLEVYLKLKCSELILLKYGDHHNYKSHEIDKILKVFDEQFTKNKIIVTTEKDVMRLINSPYFSRFNNKPFYYVPVKTKFHHPDNEEFNMQILNYVTENKRNS
jgi:tetraacyldisaccharide 4'-kinase